MVTLFYKKRKMELPESFNELSGKQFIRIADLLYKGGDFLKCQVKALLILSGMSRFRFMLLPVEFIDRARENVNWCLEESAVLSVTKQMIPLYKGCHGPVSDFDNLKMGEFHWSEIYFRAHLTPATSPRPSPQSGEGDSDALNHLVAVLYREEKKDYDKKRNPDGDMRERFNAHAVEYNAKRIARWPAAVKQAIFLWYDACRNKLIEDNPLVFEEPTRSYESEFDTGLYGMMRSLAGDKLGPVEKIEDMYVHTAMLEVGLIREQEKRLEEEMEHSKQ